jgi:DNA-directed RNA polymerase specialized sigma24 family protein
VQRCDAWTFAVAYNTACDRLARAAEERHESA